MNYRLIILCLLCCVWATYAHGQQADTGAYNLAADTSFLHQVNKDPTGYLSGNEGLCTMLKGFYTLPGQNQIEAKVGTTDNFCVTLMLKKLHFGFTGIIGEGSNKPNDQLYCQTYANAYLGAGTVSQPSAIYYKEKYQVLGLFTTLPFGRISADARIMVARYSWYSPDATFNFTQNGITTQQNMSGVNIISWAIMPGLGFRYVFFERFSLILNADLIDNFDRGPRILMLHTTGGVAYEL